MVTIPRPLLTSRLPSAHRLGGRRVAAGSGVGALTGSLVQQLYRLDDTTRDDVASRFAASALDIVVTAFDAEADGSPRPTTQQQRLDDAKRYILARLDDSELDLETIAKSQDMAPRTLYRLFAAEDTTPIRWLWQQRLAASFKALTEGRATQVTDAALSCGFTDVSHFSRAFRATFGQSPRVFVRHRR